jgi:hypothetical protein
MAVWRRKPTNKVLIHSDQGSQFTSMDWAAFLNAHNLEHSMSRRGNCHDNAVAESFFNLLKRERIRRRTYKTRVEARQDVFDYIEMFYNPTRKHVEERDAVARRVRTAAENEDRGCLENSGLFTLLIAAGHNTGCSNDFATTSFAQQDAVACLISRNWCSVRCRCLTGDSQEHQKGNGGQDNSRQTIHGFSGMCRMQRI